MYLSDLKLSDVGKFVRVGTTTSHVFIQGTLHHVETETVEERSIGQAPGYGDTVVTGYTVTVGGWTRGQLSGSTEVELL